MIERVSSHAPPLQLRDTAISLQRALARANGEVSSGRRYDLAEALGADLGRNEQSRVRQAALDALNAQDDVAGARVDTISTTLAHLRAGLGDLRDQLVAAAHAPQARDGVIEAANRLLGSFTSAMGQDLAGVALFGGQTLDAPAVASYDPTRASGPAASVASAFQAAFGMTQDDPAAGTITASAMTSFLKGAFAQEFQQPAWSANWSRATDGDFRSRIAPGETAPTTVSANEGALRDIARIAVMTSDLALGKLNDATFSALATHAGSLATAAIDATTKIEARMGVSKQRITDAQAAMSATHDLLARQIGAQEDVDPTEAATRVNDLTTRLEATFAITARMRDLSLLKYL